MARWLIPRPAETAAELAAALSAAGHEAVVAPVLTVDFAGAEPVDLAGVQALLFTSGNGVRGFARLEARRDLPVLAVGEATAAAARQAGFAQVTAAGGTAADLARFAIATLDPRQGALFHGAGRTLAGDLKGALEAAGFDVRQAVLYEARAVDRLPPPAEDALRADALDGVLLLSPRTAAVFVGLVRSAELMPRLGRLLAVCLSPAVAERLDPSDWAEIRIAPRPDTPGLLAVLDPPTAPGPDMQPDTPAPDPIGAPDAPEPPAADPTADPAAEPGDLPHDLPPGAETTPAGRIIALFGGIRPMAGKLAVPVTTVQGWKKRGAIPATRHADILAAAERHGLALDPALLAAADPAPAAHDPLSAAAGESEAAPEPARPMPASPPTSPVPPAAPARSTGLGGAALVVALLALAAAVAALFWSPGAGDGTAGDTALDGRVAALEETVAGLAPGAGGGAAVADLAERLDRLEQAAGGADPRVDDLAGRLAALEQAVAAAAETPAADPALAERLAGLEGRVGGQEDAAAALTEQLAALGDQLAGFQERLAAEAELGATVSALQTRLDGLAGDLAALTSRVDDLAAAVEAQGAVDPVAQALVLAVGQLRDASQDGRPFAEALATLRPLLADDPDLAARVEPLAGPAEAGIPGRAALAARFPEMARQVLAAAGTADDVDWLDQALGTVQGLVTVRRAPGEVEGDDAGAVLARAEGRLQNGDLAGAVEALAALTGPAAEAAAPWLEAARNRLLLEDSLQALGGAAIARLGGTAAAAPASP